MDSGHDCHSGPGNPDKGRRRAIPGPSTIAANRFGGGGRVAITPVKPTVGHRGGRRRCPHSTGPDDRTDPLLVVPAIVDDVETVMWLHIGEI